MKNNKSGAIAFVISLLLTLLLLGGIYFGFLIYTKAQFAEKIKTDIIYDEKVYEGTAEQNLSVLVVCNEKIESKPALFLLFCYNAPQKSLTVKALPPDKIIAVEGRTASLSEHYGYEGLRGAQRAAAVLENRQIDRYLRITMKGIQNTGDFLGGLSLDVKSDVVTPYCTIKKGRQTLDGRRIASLLLCSDLPLNKKEELILMLLKKSLNETLSAKYDSLKSVIFKNGETNLTSYDFTFRQSCITKLCEENSLQITAT